MSRIEELEKKLAADPNSRIFVQLAEEYRKQGLLENAIEICEQGLTKHPQYPSARVALGRALLEAQSFDRASEEFEAVLAQIPDNILANKFLGETYHRLGRYDEAIQKYQIARTLSPEDMELDGKIEAVKAEMAAGGPPAGAAQPAAGTAAAATPSPPPPASPSTSPTPPSPPTPMNLSLGAPPPLPQPEPLEPTLVDARAVLPEIPDGPDRDFGPPPLPDDLDPEDEILTSPQDDLPPIPLVEVDEPMVLEGSPYANLDSAPEPPPLDPVPIVSSMEAFEMTPPLSPATHEPLDPDPPAPPPPLEPPTLEAEPPPLPEPSELPHVDAVPIYDEAAKQLATPAEADGGTDIETETMAELYASQGHFDRAVLVYRNLLVRDPNETKYLERIEELEMLANASAESAPAAPGGRVEPRGDAPEDPATRETIEVLEQWLDVIRRSRRA